MTYPIEVQGSAAKPYVIDQDGAGNLWCTCPGWKFAKSTPKVCKHIRAHLTDAPPLKLAAEPAKPKPPAVTAGSLVKPMKLDHGNTDQIANYLRDDNWVAEQKVDGIRVTVTVTPDGQYRFGNGAGEQLKASVAVQHTAALARALTPAEVEYTIDGELLWTGEFWAFDILAAGTLDVLGMELSARRMMLETLLEKVSVGPPANLLPQAKTTEEKLKLLRDVEAAGGEGIVLKNLGRPYLPGTRAATTSQTKVKFRKTVDCIVTARNTRDKENAELAVYENGKLRDIGSCSMLGKPDAQVGDVVEVAYLYATDDLHVYQPSLARIRTDKPAHECTIDQLTPVNKEIIR